MNNILERAKRASKFNDIQATTVLVITVMNISAALSSEEPAGFWLWAFAIGLWPAVAFVANFVNPPPQDKEVTKDELNDLPF